MPRSNSHGSGGSDLKDFVTSIDTCLRTILIPVVIFLCGLWITAYAKLKLSHTMIQVIAGGMPIEFITVGILACLTSSLKNCNSIDGAAFQIVKWLLLPVVLFPTTLFWMSLRFAVKISIFIVCPLGSISDLAILFAWYWYFYSEEPKIPRGPEEAVPEQVQHSNEPNSDNQLQPNIDIRIQIEEQQNAQVNGSQVQLGEKKAVQIAQDVLVQIVEHQIPQVNSSQVQLGEQQAAQIAQDIQVQKVEHHIAQVNGSQVQMGEQAAQIPQNGPDSQGVGNQIISEENEILEAVVADNFQETQPQPQGSSVQLGFALIRSGSQAKYAEAIRLWAEPLWARFFSSDESQVLGKGSIKEVPPKKRNSKKAAAHVETEIKRMKTHPIARVRIVQQDPAPPHAEEEQAKHGDAEEDRASDGAE